MLYLFDRLQGNDDLNVVSLSIMDSIVRETGKSIDGATSQYGQRVQLGTSKRGYAKFQ
jgi:hypothetical protein